MPTTRRAPLLALAPLAAFVCACTTPGAGAQIDLRVDAREIHRSLVHARIDMPAEPGPNHIHYVEWVPGNHNPSGPIWNVVDFYARDAEGNALEWDRDPRDPFRIAVHAPDGADSITIEHTYIANQSWANSRSTDTYGRPGYGGLNWNSVMFYPEGADKDELVVDAALVLPEGWAVRSPMPIDHMAPNLSAGADSDFDEQHLLELREGIDGRSTRHDMTVTRHLKIEETLLFGAVVPGPDFFARGVQSHHESRSVMGGGDLAVLEREVDHPAAVRLKDCQDLFHLHCHVASVCPAETLSRRALGGPDSVRPSVRLVRIAAVTQLAACDHKRKSGRLCVAIGLQAPDNANSVKLLDPESAPRSSQPFPGLVVVAPAHNALAVRYLGDWSTGCYNACTA